MSSKTSLRMFPADKKQKIQESHAKFDQLFRIEVKI